MLSILTGNTTLEHIEAIEYIFMYDSEADLDSLFIPQDLLDKFCSIEWIYLSEIPKYALIGISSKDGKIYTMDEDCEIFFLCDHLHQVPFLMMLAYLPGSDKKHQLHYNEDYKGYLKFLNSYVLLLEKNQIEIENKYLEIIRG